MTVAIDVGELDGSVLLPAVVWDQMLAELGQLPPAPHIKPFADEPWRQLPTMEDLEKLWAKSTLDQEIFRLAHKIHGDGGEDLMKFMAEQRQLAELELAWIKEAEYAGQRDAFDTGGPGEDEPVGIVGPGGSGVGVPGEPQNGDPVDTGGEAGGDPDAGRPPKVSRKRRPGKAG